MKACINNWCKKKKTILYYILILLTIVSQPASVKQKFFFRWLYSSFLFFMWCAFVMWRYSGRHYCTFVAYQVWVTSHVHPLYLEGSSLWFVRFSVLPCCLSLWLPAYLSCTFGLVCLFGLNTVPVADFQPVWPHNKISFNCTCPACRVCFSRNLFTPVAEAYHWGIYAWWLPYQ